MQLNPITNKLYTDDNRLIKKMYCPYPSLMWTHLSSIDRSMDRFCAICESNVIDTLNIGDDDLWQLLQDEPESCLKIDRNQKNVRIVHHV